MARRRYLTDEEFHSFRTSAPPMFQCAMDLGLLTGSELAALLRLTWKDVKTIGVPRREWQMMVSRIRSDEPRKIPITPAIETVLKRCRVLEPNWPHNYVLRLDDGQGFSTRMFNRIWNLYMKGWVLLGNDRTAFAFSDVRIKALTEQQDARRVRRRRTPSGSSTARN